MTSIPTAPSQTSFTAQQLMDLALSAQEVLYGNLRDVKGEQFAVPSGLLYPAAWGWDTPQMAAGLYASNPDIALRIMEDFLHYQWPNGMIPQIVFPEVTADTRLPEGGYFPPPHIWYMTDAIVQDYQKVPPHAYQNHPAFALTHGKTTGIPQYPIWASQLLAMHEQRPIPKDRLQPLLEKIEASHRYFLEWCDPLKLGMAAEFHPWMGCDNAPIYDHVLQKTSASAADIERERIAAQRVDLRNVVAAGGAPSQRPSDDDYVAFVKMAHALADVTKRELRGHPTSVEDLPMALYTPMLNGLLIRAEQDLAKLAKSCGNYTMARNASRRADSIRGAMISHLWHDQAQSFGVLDAQQRTLNPSSFIGNLLPLLDEKLPEFQKSFCMHRLQKDFLGQHALGFATVPHALGKSSNEANPECYWRGPVWLNLAAMLLPYAPDPEASRSRLLATTMKEGFREYFNAHTGEGYGTERFGWTAAYASQWALQQLQELQQSPELSTRLQANRAWRQWQICTKAWELMGASGISLAGCHVTFLGRHDSLNGGEKIAMHCRTVDDASALAASLLKTFRGNSGITLERQNNVLLMPTTKLLSLNIAMSR